VIYRWRCVRQEQQSYPAAFRPLKLLAKKRVHSTFTREKKLIAQALAATDGNVTAAAKKLGISRRTLHRKINEMNLARASKTTGRSASATKAPPRE